MLKAIVLGAGPAGLTAAYEASKKGIDVSVFEKSAEVGGISKTVAHNGYLFDLGGHRFFTKYEEVLRLWDEILGPEFLTRPRLSRIYYNRKFFYYPLKPVNALANLGILQSFLVGLSYLHSRIRPVRDVRSFEDWVSNQFGKRLFNIFFKTYTEKVWGMSCTELRADWAAQRIKSLSLGKAVLDALGLTKKGRVTTLIDEFRYPRKGPGQMWERARDLIEESGGRVRLKAGAERSVMKNNRIESVVIRTEKGPEEIRGDHFISSIPLRELILSMDPPVPDAVREAALGLRYRDFFTVGLVLKRKDVFPDNWIYIHAPEVLVGRIQNFKNWSPEMVPDPATTSLGLEYFCFETDPIWSRPDGELIEMASRELVTLGFAETGDVTDGVVVRSPKTYPIYDDGYAGRVGILRDFLSTIGNLQTIGRNGLHRYNNQDHSMLTALMAVRNILGGKDSVWEVNVDDEYHETIEKRD